MITISTTMIDQYRYFLSKEEYSEDDFINYIKGESVPNKFAEMGTAFHSIIENPKKHYLKEHNIYESNGICYEPSIINPCIEHINYLYPFEVKTSKIYQVRGFQVKVIAKVDQAKGEYVEEFKTNWTEYKYNKYLESYQWRFYIDIFQASRVFYTVFDLTSSAKGVKLNDIHEFDFPRYKNLAEDIQHLLGEFVDYIMHRNLKQYFEKPDSEPIKQLTNPITNEETMKLTRIRIENILGITNFEVVPGKFTEITGKNGSGKTSVMESIKAALQGGTDATLLRNGTNSGEVILILDDTIQIQRKIKESKNNKINSELTVYDNHGRKVNKPQTYVDTLMDMLSVNPIQFLTASKSQRVSVLLETLPLELPKDELKTILEPVPQELNIIYDGHALEVLSNNKKVIFEERTSINRVIKEKEHSISQLKESLVEVDFSPEEIKAKIAELEEKITKKNAKKEDFTKYINDEKHKKLDALRNEYESKLQELNEEYSSNKQKVEDHVNEQIKALNKQYYESYSPLVDEISSLKGKEEVSGGILKTKSLINQYQTETSKLQKDSELLSGVLEKLEVIKEKMLSNLPIPGLELKDGEIYCENVPFDRLNTAKQIQIALEIAKLRAGDLGLICIDGLERLDAETFELFKQEALQTDLQMIVTKVTDDEFNVQTT